MEQICQQIIDTRTKIIIYQKEQNPCFSLPSLASSLQSSECKCDTWTHANSKTQKLNIQTRNALRIIIITDHFLQWIPPLRSLPLFTSPLPRCSALPSWPSLPSTSTATPSTTSSTASSNSAANLSPPPTTKTTTEKRKQTPI